MPVSETAIVASPCPSAAWHGDLSIVIPSYNSKDLLRRTLRAIDEVAPTAEVVVSDSASADGSTQMVRDEFPRAKILEHPNYGFAFAINTGIAAAQRGFLLLMNSDLFVTAAALDLMHRRLGEEPRLGAVAPILVNVDGSRQSLFGGLYWPLWAPVRERRSVGLLSAACLMTRRDVVDAVGGLDENLFFYNEERDWCRQLQDHGYQLEVVGEKVVHIGGGSTKRGPLLRLEERRGFLYVGRKHGWRSVTLMRWGLALQGFLYRFLDPRREWRQMWQRQWDIMSRGDLLASPFPLSGRGFPALPPGASPPSTPTPAS